MVGVGGGEGGGLPPAFPTRYCTSVQFTNVVLELLVNIVSDLTKYYLKLGAANSSPPIISISQQVQKKCGRHNIGLFQM